MRGKCAGPMEMDMVETLHQLTVLVVDDEALMRELLETYLGSRGYRVVCAVSGEECLELMRHDLPDVVLLDGMLPGMDGWEVCRHIREQSNVPILMLSARAQNSDREKGLAAGADDYITKPFSIKEVDLKIQGVVSRSRTRPGTN
jgi:DNA-binding response OmpR family regulator